MGPPPFPMPPVSPYCESNFPTHIAEIIDIQIKRIERTLPMRKQMICIKLHHDLLIDTFKKIFSVAPGGQKSCLGDWIAVRLRNLKAASTSTPAS
jgi:hypothetical protein